MPRVDQEIDPYRVRRIIAASVNVLRPLSHFAARVGADIDPYGRFSNSKVLRW